MLEEINHNCGLCVAHTLHDAYSFIKSLQHRGREAAGIAAISKDRIDVMKWIGKVEDFDLGDFHKIFPNKYEMFMTHVRYATRGRKDKILEDAHPHVIGGIIKHRGNHVLILDCEMAAVHNGQVEMSYLEGIETELLKTGCDTEALLHFFKNKGENEMLKQIPGAYTIAIAQKHNENIIVLRDRTGIKPGVLGWKDGKYGIASEDIAFRENGGKFIENLNPGSAYYLNFDGTYRKEKVVEPEIKHCFFEWNYLGSADSVINRISVKSLRELFGETAAQEFHPEADLITFLPRCPEDAARGYANARGMTFASVFYKKESERAFQGSTAMDRKKSIDKNLFLLPHVVDSENNKINLEGKTIILMDDSIVRANNAEKARQLLYEEAKIKKAYYGYLFDICRLS